VHHSYVVDGPLGVIGLEEVLWLVDVLAKLQIVYLAHVALVKIFPD